MIELPLHPLEMIFWFAAALVGYTYLGYPLCVYSLASIRRRSEPKEPAYRGGVSVVLAVYNEELVIERRLTELTSMLTRSGRQGEIIVVSDGSTDATVQLARATQNDLVRVLELPQNVGKATALNEGVAAARHDIVVFADVRQTWALDALARLLERFADPAVGAVSGELVIESSPGVMAGVGLYWRYEKWLRKQESRVHSTVGVTGAISAVRRALYRPIPPRTLLDDVYWPLAVVLQGYRVVFEKNAIAYDRLPEKPADEFRRKVRTLSGNFQLVSRLPALLVPWRNPVWLQLVSHKLLRLAAPWALLLMLIVSPFLEGPFYWLLFVFQLSGYGLAVAGIWTRSQSYTRVSAAAASFLVLNAAAWLAFWVWVTGKAARSWHKARYHAGPAPLRAGSASDGQAVTPSLTLPARQATHPAAERV
jgi:cellulose synthase/poly-beta-1,6-N-acetylglucosamine synthase-like glycosyltransferase